MPIISSEIFDVINKPGGRRKLLMKAVDDLGRVWEKRPNVPADNDDAATLAEWVAGLESTFPQAEANEEKERALKGKSKPAEYQTQASLDKETIALLMQIDDAAEFAKSLQWFRDFEMRAGANNNARASYLGVTNVQYGLVAERFNQISGIQAGLETDAERVWLTGDGWL